MSERGPSERIGRAVASLKSKYDLLQVVLYLIIDPMSVALNSAVMVAMVRV